MVARLSQWDGDGRLVHNFPGKCNGGLGSTRWLVSYHAGDPSATPAGDTGAEGNPPSRWEPWNKLNHRCPPRARGADREWGREPIPRHDQRLGAQAF